MAEPMVVKGGPKTEDLLQVLIATAGRIAFPLERLIEIVSPTGSQKYVKAYNLCDGTRGLSDVARLASLDKSNLNKSVSRWVEAGILFKVGELPALLHLYAISSGGREGDLPLDADDISDGSEPIGPKLPRPTPKRSPVTTGTTIGVESQTDIGR